MVTSSPDLAIDVDNNAVYYLGFAGAGSFASAFPGMPYTLI